MKIVANSVAAIEYTLTDIHGTVLDTSVGAPPLEYLHGAGNIITGLERELLGLAPGDSKKVVVKPADGYGERDDALVLEVPRSQFPPEDAIEVGMRFHAQMSNGQPHVVSIVAIKDDTVTLDANHELAGAELHFDVKVVSVREATPDEIAHGHPHVEHHCCGGHGHDHGGDGCCGGHHHH